jgi:HEAT repeat protein
MGTGLDDFLAEALYAPEARIRHAATNALVELRARSKAPQIAELLDDPDLRVRFAATKALGELRASAGIVPLYRLMLGENVGLRSAAAHALCHMPGAKPVLEQAARSPSLAVREVAKAALVSWDGVENNSEE